MQPTPSGRASLAVETRIESALEATMTSRIIERLMPQHCETCTCGGQSMHEISEFRATEKKLYRGVPTLGCLALRPVPDDETVEETTDPHTGLPMYLVGLGYVGYCGERTVAGDYCEEHRDSSRVPFRWQRRDQ